MNEEDIIKLFDAAIMANDHARGLTKEIQQLKAELAEKDARIRELENSLNDLCEIINEYDILNSDDEIGVVMPNKDREKMRKARELLKQALGEE